MTDRLSIPKAITIGLVVVNGPVLALLLGGVLIASRVANDTVDAPSIIVFVGGFGLAWLWWSLAVPRWRAWALGRGVDAAGLQQWGERVGLVWRKGSVFEKTELPPRGPRQGGGAA